MKRMSRYIAVVALIVLATGLTAATSRRSFRAHLTGASEIPARDTRATGQATFHLSRDGSELSYKLIVANISNVIAAHIHFGTSTQVGPPVITLYVTPTPGEAAGRFSGVLAEGVITDADVNGVAGLDSVEELVQAMKNGQTYVNVHTNDFEGEINTGPGDFPDGEIRGQVR